MGRDKFLPLSSNVFTMRGPEILEDAVFTMRKPFGLNPTVLRNLLLKTHLAKRTDRCPKCGSADLVRSRRRNFLERALSDAVLPYRCEYCHVRFFRTHDPVAESPKTPEAHAQPKPRAMAKGA